MAAPSAQTLQRVADETGHQPGTIEKVMRLLDMLEKIARDPVLSERLVLKGGTALNVFHLGLDRLSVDIDLNYVGALDRAAMEAERPTVDAALILCGRSVPNVRLRRGQKDTSIVTPRSFKRARASLSKLSTRLLRSRVMAA